MADKPIPKFTSELERTLLGYVVLFRAGPRMSAVHQTLREFNTRYHTGQLKAGDLLTNRCYLLEAIFQLVSEVVLNSLIRTNRIKRGELQVAQLVLKIPGQNWQSSQQPRTWPTTRSAGLDHCFDAIEHTLRDAPENSSPRELLNKSLSIGADLRDLLQLALDESGTLLSSGPELVSRVSNAKEELGFSDLEPGSIGDLLLSTLTDLMPIVARSNDASGRWEFKYQPNGDPVPPANQPVIAPLVASNDEAYETAVATIRSAWCFLNGINLDPETEVSWNDGPISFEDLAQAKIIKLRPAWSVIQRILRKTPKDKLTQTQLGNLVDFANMLETSTQTLTSTFKILSLIALLSDTSPLSKRLGAAFHSLTKWVRKRDEDSISKTFRWLIQTVPIVGGNVGWLELQARPIPNVCSELSRILQFRRQEPDNEHVQKALRRLQLTAWSGWFDRLKSRAKKPKGQLVSNFVLDAMRIVPGCLFCPDLSTMTIAKWSQIFVHSLRVETSSIDGTNKPACPVWVGAFALRRLGVAPNIIVAFLDHFDQAIAQQDSLWDAAFAEFEMSTHHELGKATRRFFAEDARKRELSSVTTLSRTTPLAFDLIVSAPGQSHRLSDEFPIDGSPCLALDGLDQAQQLWQLCQAVKLPFQIRNVFIDQPRPEWDPSDLIGPLANCYCAESHVVGVFDQLPSHSMFVWAVQRPESLASLLDRDWD